MPGWAMAFSREGLLSMLFNPQYRPLSLPVGGLFAIYQSVLPKPLLRVIAVISRALPHFAIRLEWQPFHKTGDSAHDSHPHVFERTGKTASVATHFTPARHPMTAENANTRSNNRRTAAGVTSCVTIISVAAPSSRSRSISGVSSSPSAK